MGCLRLAAKEASQMEEVERLEPKGPSATRDTSEEQTVREKELTIIGFMLYNEKFIWVVLDGR